MRLVAAAATTGRPLLLEGRWLPLGGAGAGSSLDEGGFQRAVMCGSRATCTLALLFDHRLTLRPRPCAHARAGPLVDVGAVGFGSAFSRSPGGPSAKSGFQGRCCI